MPETPDRIIKQLEADTITGTDNSTRRRMEKKGAFPLRFQITENGATGYLLSEVLAWIETRAANRSLSTKTAPATKVRHPARI
jgi:predicted DNA-binding transcriptional regulator AlpA